MGEGVYKRQFMEKVDIKVQKEKKVMVHEHFSDCFR